MLDNQRVLSFDLDDTLWPCLLTIHKAEKALFGWFEHHTPRLANANYSIEELRAERQKFASSMPQLAHNFNAIRRIQLERLFKVHGYKPSLATQAVHYFQQYRNRVYPYDDVIPMLLKLGKSFTLVSLTNGTTEIAQTALDGLFHYSFNAVDAGAAKPQPAIFELVIEATKAAPDEITHFGDDPYNDIEPARRLGLGAIWVNRFNQDWPDDLDHPEFHIQSLAEIHL